MPYKIKLAKQAEEQMLSWDFPSGVFDLLCQKLFRELADQGPAMLGEEVVPLAHCRALHITVDDPSQFPYRYWFVFVVDCGTPGELHILSGRPAIDTERN